LPSCSSLGGLLDPIGLTTPTSWRTIGDTMNQAHPPKTVIWIASSKKDLKEFPQKVSEAILIDLEVVMLGHKPGKAEPLKRFKGAKVLEIIKNHNTDTYRVVYTVEFAPFVYVLHAFKKKSKEGIKTPQQDIDLIKTRRSNVQKDYEQRTKKHQ
jgi:phage-related protein